MELVVRDGRFFTIGDEGAQFFHYKKNDIIFNAAQTESLFKYGGIKGANPRGKMLANGTAFNNGVAFAEGTAFPGGTTSGMPKDEDDSNEETFDWLETRLSRLERVIDKLDKAVNNIYDSWDKRDKKLDSEIYQNDKLIETLRQAVDVTNPESYRRKAIDYDLDPEIKELVHKGAIDPDDIQDEELAEKIKEYQEIYEKYLDADEKLAEALITRSELYAQRFDDVISRYDGILQGFEHTESMIDEYISQAEARGHIVSSNYYQALIDNKDNEVDELTNQRSDMIAARNDYVEAMQEQGMSLGDIYDSEQYKNMSAEIDGVTQDIEAATTQTIEWQNAIRDLEFEQFELAHERMSRLSSEAEFLIDLMSNKNLHNDDGSLTDEGMATMGLLTQNYNQAMYEADDYGAKAADIARRMQLDPSEEGYLDPLDQNNIDKYNEYIELQRESILNAEDQKQAIKDLVEEGIKLELEALQERIDLHNEELDSMKDLYDYQKQVQEQTENIASLQKQLRAYEGFTDEETRATVQKLKVELESAQQDLEETEFDRYLSQQEELLSSLYEEYELTLNTRLDDLDGLVEDVFNAVEDNAEEIAETLFGTDGTGGVAASVGAAVSDELQSIWTGEGVGNKIAGSVSAIKGVLDGIAGNVATLAGKSNEEAEDKIEQPKTTTSATSNPTGGSSGSGGSGGSPSGSGSPSGGDGRAKIGDKVKFLSGKYYYDSQGVNPAGSRNHGKQVYITNINKRSWATHPYHISTGKKLGQGDLGWLKLNQLSGYAVGKKNFLDNEIAWTQEKGQEFIVRPSDGAILTPIAKGDSVLTSAASNNIWDMANSPTDFIKDNLNLGAANVPNNFNVQNVYSQNFENIVFSMPNVKNYGELLSALQKDPKFDKLIKAMTLDQIAGKSSLAKNKSIR